MLETKKYNSYTREQLEYSLERAESRLRELDYNFCNWKTSEVKSFINEVDKDKFTDLVGMIKDLDYFDKEEKERAESTLISMLGDEIYEYSFCVPSYNSCLLGYARDHLQLGFDDEKIFNGDIYEVIAYNMEQEARSEFFDNINKYVDMFLERF